MKRQIFSTALLSLTFLGLGACSLPQKSYDSVQLRHPVKVAETIERLELHTRPDGLELSARDELAVSQFLDGYARSGEGPLYVNVPANVEERQGLHKAGVVIRDLMARSGISPEALQAGEYTAPSGGAPVVVSYRRLQAIAQDCRYMSDLTRTYNGQAREGFGCWNSANLAAMVSDPRQLLEPYAAGTPNAQRRQVVYDKYISGSSTGSATSPEQSLSVEN